MWSGWSSLIFLSHLFYDQAIIDVISALQVWSYECKRIQNPGLGEWDDINRLLGVLGEFSSDGKLI